MTLVVYTPSIQIFDAYYYGYGQVVNQEALIEDDRMVVCTVVDYGQDSYHAEYQRDRFLSGLYHARLV